MLIFPEGTRGNGVELLPFKRGAFHLAVKSGAPIVPVIIASHEKYAGKEILPVSILGVLFFLIFDKKLKVPHQKI